MLRPVGLAAGEPWDQEAAIRRFFAILSQFQVSLTLPREKRADVACMPCCREGRSQSRRLFREVARSGSPDSHHHQTGHLIGRSLHLFQGTHSYHNFTKLSSREISRKIKSKVGAKPQVRLPLEHFRLAESGVADHQM